jgi:hypothetical protein
VAGDGWFSLADCQWKPEQGCSIAIRSTDGKVSVGIFAGFAGDGVIIIGTTDDFTIPVTPETEVKEC